MKSSLRLLFPTCAFFVASLPLAAQVIQTNFSSTNGTAPGVAVSSGDLLQTSLGSVSGPGTYYSSANQLSLLYDGVFHGGYGGTTQVVQPNVATLTFNFDVTTNTGGYSLTTIRTYASWGDEGRDGQDYTVYYSTTSAPATYVELVNLNAFDTSSEDTPSTMVQLTHSSGTLATNVASLRFVFSGYENDGSGYSEFDVMGSPSAIPEPSTYAVISGVLALGLAMRRRSRSSQAGARAAADRAGAKNGA